MKNFTFSFTGRQVGAIGIPYSITDTYKAKNVKQAFFMLYKDYEHFSKITVNGKLFEFQEIEFEEPEQPYKRTTPRK